MIAYSVVMPAFNTEAYITEAILSALAQTVPPREIVVVDDGSTDRTAAVVKSLGADIRLIQQENRGSGPATTVAIQAATTALIAGLDSMMSGCRTRWSSSCRCCRRCRRLPRASPACGSSVTAGTRMPAAARRPMPGSGRRW